MPQLIVIAGPTASGKTRMGIELAQHFDTEIISCDARQFYRELEIGTAKPSAAELGAAPHHFINNRSVFDDYTVGDYEREVLQFLDGFFQKKDKALLVGGSGLFMRSVCEGLNVFPAVKAGIREALLEKYEQQGLVALQEELVIADPDYYDEVDLNNPQRLMRALEVCRSAPHPFSYYRNQPKPARPFDCIKFAPEWPRETLYQRINQRCDQMLEAGLLEEVRAFQAHQDLNALQTVGYQEFFPYLEGKYSLEEATALFKRNSRRYAKRQLTWLRKSKVQWVQSTAEVIAALT